MQWSRYKWDTTHKHFTWLTPNQGAGKVRRKETNTRSDRSRDNDKMCQTCVWVCMQSEQYLPLFMLRVNSVKAFSYQSFAPIFLQTTFTFTLVTVERVKEQTGWKPSMQHVQYQQVWKVERPTIRHKETKEEKHDTWQRLSQITKGRLAQKEGKGRCDKERVIWMKCKRTQGRVVSQCGMVAFWHM